MHTFIEYLKDTKMEMKHVSWPTKEQTIAYTLLVIAISIVVGVLLGAFDGLFKQALTTYILK